MMKSRHDRKELVSEQSLGRCRLFDGAGQIELHQLEKLAVTKEYRKGQIIFSEGEPSRGLCLVADGTVKLHRVSPNGREILLRVVQTGDSFAEEAAFVPCYSASAQALAAATQVVWFERHGFQQLLAGSERLSLRIFETLALRVCQLTDTQADHKLKEAAARLASYLLSLSAGADRT